MRSPGALTAWLIACGASILLAACSAFGINPITPTRAMVTGTWVHKGGVVLVLRKNGTFAGSGMPYFFGEIAGPTPRAGTGTWHIGRVGSDAPAGIVLDFEAPSLTQDELLVENCCGMPLTIYYDLGDPDEGITGQYQLTGQRP
jgi:hypothetical protein